MRFRPLLADLVALLLAAMVLSLGGTGSHLLITVSAAGLLYFVARLAFPLEPRAPRQTRPRRR